MIAEINDYIYTTKLNLDLQAIKTSCVSMEKIINNHFKDGKIEYLGNSPFTTKVFSSYNVLMYPLPEFFELYENIKSMFHTICESKNNKYYIQSWINFYKKGEFIDWHDHWASHTEGWHGFFCIDVEPSKTSYIIPTFRDTIHVNGEDNLLVIGKSIGDKHRTWPWTEDRPRITIAFDIVPRQYIDPEKWLNHWIPI